MAYVALLISCVIILITIKWWMSRKNSDLHRLPSVKKGLWDVLSKQMDVSKNHLELMELRQKFGPIVRLQLGFGTMIVLSDYDSIYEVLVKRGKAFGGRFEVYKNKDLMHNTGIIFSKMPDASWKAQRKIGQKHLRQFGDGLSRLESIISSVAEDMFSEFQNNIDQPFEPRKIVFDTTLNSIAFLITGQRTHIGDPIIEKMREYEKLFLTTLNPFTPFTFKLLNIFPWLKYIGFDKWPRYQRLVKLHKEIWQIVKHMNNESPESESIFKVFESHIADAGGLVKEQDAQSASLALLFAGVTTTSTTFHCTVNILAHHPNIQEKIHEELQRTESVRSGKSVLSIRNKMPYTRAFLYEILRYTSVVPQGVQHETVEDTEVSGYKIPKNTAVLTLTYNLHHDEKFWGDPYTFRPQRYLDESGELVPADHPNRTHLLAFGAGTRVCLGESLALGRLFIWITTLVERFRIEPAEGNVESLTDPRNYNFMGVLQSETYKVVFKNRN